jgi:endonuclease YncB( thermonuclease family)
MRRSIGARRQRDGEATCCWSRWRLVQLAIIALVWTVGGAFPSEPKTTSDRAGTEVQTGEWRHVTRVIDGDTIILDGGERLRLIGVDTPETVHPQKPVEYFGKEASAFTRRTVEGKRVRLEYEQGAPREDRYGRTLGYVYLEDGRLLNLEIIAGGYGHAYTRFPFSKMEEFRAGERDAREAGKGLWGEPHGSRSPPADQPGVRPGFEGSSGSCIPASQCCKVCRKGQACGNSCISRSYTCRKGRGCACDAAEVCR